MNLEQQLGAALAPCKPAPALRAAVLARIASAARPASALRRGGRRTILFGTVLAVAAAAAMLVFQLRDVRPIVATLVPAQTASSAHLEPVADAADTPHADSGKSAASEHTIRVAAAPQTFTVQVLPLHLPDADPAVQAALNEFYTKAVSELGAVPGLLLLAAGDAAGATDYRLTFNGGFEDVAAIAERSKESGQAQPVPAASRMWRMQLSAESRRAPASATRTLTLVDDRRVVSTSDQAAVDLNIIPSNLLERMEAVTSGASATYGSGAMSGVVNQVLNRRVEGIRIDVKESGAVSATIVTNHNEEDARKGVEEKARKEQVMTVLNPQQPDGFTLVYRHVVVGSPAQDPAGLAAAEIEGLRMAVFPVDAELYGKLRARLLDANQPHERRLAALQLLAAQEEGLENPQTIRGAFALLAAGPTAPTRAAVWRLLRGKPQAAVLHPLLDLLGTARDATLKLEILTTLAADYKDDPAALAALQSIVAHDPDALVRNVAARGMSGEAAWREYATTTIRDARLTPAERFAPVAYLIQAEQGQDVRNLLDEQTLQALVAVLPPLLEDRANQQGFNYLLGNLHGVRSPLLVDLALAGLDRDLEWSTASMLVSLLGGYRDEPRVQQRLKEIAASDDPKLSALAKAMLNRPWTEGLQVVPLPAR